jgi:ribonuclease J
MNTDFNKESYQNTKKQAGRSDNFVRHNNHNNQNKQTPKKQVDAQFDVLNFSLDDLDKKSPTTSSPRKKTFAPREQKKKTIPEKAVKKADFKKETGHQKSPVKSNYNKNQARNKKPAEVNRISIGPKGKLRIIPIGGCEEVGRNMNIFEYENDIVIIDMGMQFPEEDMPGIDYIIPNIDYLKGKEKNIRGVIITHGHLDHTGAAPILLEQLGYPMIVGSKLTVHMIKGRCEDHKKGSSKSLKAKIVTDFDQTLRLGKFDVKFFPVAHSIMDALGIILETPNGSIIHPGDWKLEKDPKKEQFDFTKLQDIKKPSYLMLESLGVTYKRDPLPEQEMYQNIENIITEARGRVIIGTFSSNVERVKVVLEMAEKLGKKVAVDGFSMKTNIGIAKKLGYIKFNLKNLISVEQSTKLPDGKVVMVCTGAQGEENAVLPRIANGEHRFIKLKKEDTVIFSSSVIPGNERSVQKLKDLIYRQSDHVIHSEIMDVHSGGHATAKDILTVLDEVKPTYFIPVYANHYMLKEAAMLATRHGFDKNKIIIPDNGTIIEVDARETKVLAQKANTDLVFVDGLGISNTQNIVLRDRQILAEDGMVVVIATISKRDGVLVQNPDIISRGFVYLKENFELIQETRKKVRKMVESRNPRTPVEGDYIKNKIRNDVGQFLFTKTGKRPMILPVVIEV